MKTHHAIRLLSVCFCTCIGLLAQAQTPPPKKPPAAPAKRAASPLPPFPPSPIDLKAAYCRPVVAFQIGERQDALRADLPPHLHNAAQERLNAAIDRRRQLEFYLLPRLDTLQASGLLDAQARGYNDAASLVALARTCSAKCSGMDTTAAAACRQQCSDGNDATKRAHGCDDISWLPLKDP